MNQFSLELGDLSHLTLTMSRQPQTSALAHLAEVSFGRQSLPAAWHQAIVSVVDRSFFPKMTPLHAGVPPWLTGDVFAPAQTIKDRMDEFQDLAVGEFQYRILAAFGQRPPRSWQLVLRSPRPWIDAVATNLIRAGVVVQREWPRAQWLLEREERRILAATTPHTKRALLANLTPGLRLVGTQLRGSYHTAVSLTAISELRLVPAISGHPPFQWGMDDYPNDDQVAWLSYPLPGLAQLQDQGSAVVRADNDQLALLLGDVRASILRFLDRPSSMYGLAEAIGCAANTATYHCGKLVEAGLVSRTRSGNTVWLQRTERGTNLIDLMHSV